MSKNKRDFIEQKLFEQFNSSENEVPDQLWERIELSLDKNEDSKRPFIFIYFFIFFICAGLGSYIIVHQDNLFAQSGKISLNEQNLTEKIEINNTGNTSDKNIVKVSSGNNSTLKNDYDKSNIRNVNSRDLMQSDEVSINKTTIKENAEALIIDKENPKSILNKSVTNQNSNSSAKSITGNKTNQSGQTQTQTEINNSMSDVGGSSQKINENNSFNQERQFNYNSLAEIAGKDLQMDELSDMCIPEFEYNDRPVFSKKNAIRTFVSFSTGIGYSIRNVDVNRGETYILKNREKTEIPYYNLNFAINGGILIHKEWTVTAGIEYIVITEKFDYYRKNATFINEDGLSETGDLKVTGPIRHTSVNLPFDLGYERRMGKWKLGLEAGVAINLWSAHKGKFLYADQDIRLMQNHPSLYKTNLGMQLRLACMINRNLDNRTAVFIKPRFTKYLNAWTMPTLPSQISYSLVDLNIGVRRLF